MLVLASAVNTQPRWAVVIGTVVLTAVAGWHGGRCHERQLPDRTSASDLRTPLKWRTARARPWHQPFLVAAVTAVARCRW